MKEVGEGRKLVKEGTAKKEGSKWRKEATEGSMVVVVVVVVIVVVEGSE